MTIQSIIGNNTYANVLLETIEETTMTQLYSMVNSPAFKDCKIRIMPDCHAGKGSVVGFTSDIKDRIVPNVVGVDIGCGVVAYRLGDTPIDLLELDAFIKANIPHGFSIHARTAWKKEALSKFVGEGFEATVKKLNLEESKVLASIGTLDGGNHFIEVGIDPENVKWLIIHTGSRNFGKQICEYHQKKAVEYCSDAKANTSKDLAYLPLTGELSYLGEDYLNDMAIAQAFAKINRTQIAFDILEHLGIDPSTTKLIESVHNYIDLKNKIIRKGAISAQKSELILIPFNMRDGLIVAEGLGNEDWNCSAPHGAGRIYSRGKAKKEIPLELYKESMQGIYSTCVSSATLDESPFAYKDMNFIIKAIEPLAKVHFLIKPIYNFKAA